MLATFRNIAVIVITWYVYTFVAALLAYAAQAVYELLASREPTMMLLHVFTSPSYVLLSLGAGAVAAAAVRPKRHRGWITALALLLFGHHVFSAWFTYGNSLLHIEKLLPTLLVSSLLVVGVFLGRSTLEKRLGAAP